jgi:predicted ATPase
MKLHSLEVRNYRVFTDQTPFVLPLDAAVVAFVGPNNIGKTSALRLIYELRPVWQAFEPGLLASLIGRNNGLPGGGLIGVRDQPEVFSNTNDLPIRIDWVFAKGCEDPVHIRRIKFELSRSQTVTVRVVMSNGEEIQSPGSITANPDRTSITRQDGLELFNAVDLSTIANRFAAAKFIPALRSAAATSQGTINEMPQGADLASYWRTLKTGTSKGGNGLCIRAENTLKQAFGFNDLQINVGATNDFSLLIDGKPYRLDEVGNGFAHFMCAVIETVVRPTPLVLIDEPETGLHPAMQRKLLDLVSESSGGNVYFATHSLGLARSYADRVLGMHNVGGKLHIDDIRNLRSYSEFLGELSFSAWSDVGFEAVLLVEGPVEIRGMPVLFRYLGIDTRVMPMSLGGSDFINASNEKSLAEFRRLRCPVFVLIDRDGIDGSDAIPKEREAFVESCKGLGFTTHILGRRAIENYVSDGAVRQVVRSASARALSPLERLDSVQTGWGKEQIPALLAAMPWAEIEPTDLGKFLVSLKSQLDGTRTNANIKGVTTQ